MLPPHNNHFFNTKIQISHFKSSHFQKIRNFDNQINCGKHISARQYRKMKNKYTFKIWKLSVYECWPDISSVIFKQPPVLKMKL